MIGISERGMMMPEQASIVSGNVGVVALSPVSRNATLSMASPLGSAAFPSVVLMVVTDTGRATFSTTRPC